MKAKRVDFKADAGIAIGDLLEKTGMNWLAEEQELITAAGLSVPKNKAIVRADTHSVLGVVGNRYEPVQNSTAFAFLDTLVGDHKATYEHIYLVEDGVRTIVQAKIGSEKFEVRRGDAIQGYITMINSFNGSTPFKVFFTPIRLFCTNQLNAALRKAISTVVIRHTKTADEKIEEAFEVLGKAKTYFEEFKQVATALAQKASDSMMVDMFLKDCMGDAESTRKQNQYDEVIRLSNEGLGNNGSSLWDLYNGVTEYVDHYSSKDEEKRLASALVGTGYSLKERAWNSAVKLLD